MSQTTFFLLRDINAFWFAVKVCCDKMLVISHEESFRFLVVSFRVKN